MGLWDRLLQPLSAAAPVRRARTGTYLPLGAREGETTGRGRERRACFSPLGWLCCIVLAAAAAAILDLGFLPPPLHVNDKSPADFRARADFQFESLRWLEERRAKMAEEALPVFRPVADWEKNLLRDLKRFCGIVERARTVEEAVAEVRMDSPTEARLVAALYDYQEKHRPLNFSIDFLPPLEGALRALARGGVVDQPTYDAIWNKAGERALLRLDPSSETAHVPLGRLRQFEKALSDFKWNFLQPRDFPDNLQSGLHDYLRDRLKPSLALDPEQTALERKRQAESVTDATRSFSRDAVLVAKGDIVDSEDLRLLEAEARAYKVA